MTRLICGLRFVTSVAVVTLLAYADGDSASAQDRVPTFSKDVAPIVFRQCAGCHRPGQIAPMSLLSYQDVRPWARAIKEKVVAREMPPWHADPRFGKFRNERRLSDADIDTIARWVDGGAPKGNDTDLPPQPDFKEGWQYGTPDYVIRMPVAFQLAAEGQMDIQNFFVPVPFAEDRFAEALEMRPTNPQLLHHGGAFVVQLPRGSTLVDGRAIAPNGRMIGRDNILGVGEERFETAGASKLVSYVPGRGFERHRPGVAKRIAAGKFVHFDMHYQPSGKPETDQSSLGIWFSKTPVHHEVLTRNVGNHFISQGFEGPVEVIMVDGMPRLTELLPNIPPYVENWRVVGVQPFFQDATVYAMSPHMHLRGKAMTYVVTYPDGRDEVLLSVPKYDFNWQIHYEFETPVKIPAGSKMLSIATFDNSPKNRYNPAPEKMVFWSEQSWDEMNLALIELSFDDQDLTKRTGTKP